MTISPFDHRLLSALLGDDSIAPQFSIEADYEEMFYFEEALQRALAEEGIIPRDAAEIGPGPFVPDEKLLRDGIARDGVLGPEYVRQLREWVGEPQAKHIHFGATSQDLVDTSLVLRLRPVLTEFEERLGRLATVLADLDRRFGPNCIMGRTRMQDALPITAGDRIAAWHGPLGRHLDRLRELRPRLLVLQFGGAVGTLHNLGDKARAVARRIAERLDLGLPERSWHTQRDTFGEFASWLALVSGTLGKMGQDIALMAQAGEIVLTGGGSSSAMPHKHNPVGPEVLVALARYNAAMVSAMHQAQVHEQERSGAAWTLEWLTLPQMVMTTAAALRIALKLAAQIQSIGTAGGAGMDKSPAGRLVHGLARYVALAGGVVLVIITATTVISIVGRALIPLGLGPIPGDYELVEAGIFFAIFSFLPWCHLTRAHAIVAVLTDRLPIRFNVILEALMDLLMLIVALFIAWRHWLGMLDKFGYHETTLLLRFPLWWTYLAGMLGAITFIVVAVYCLVRSLAMMVSRHPKMPESGFIE